MSTTALKEVMRALSKVHGPNLIKESLHFDHSSQVINFDVAEPKDDFLSSTSGASLSVTVLNPNVPRTSIQVDMNNFTVIKKHIDQIPDYPLKGSVDAGVAKIARCGVINNDGVWSFENWLPEDVLMVIKENRANNNLSVSEILNANGDWALHSYTKLLNSCILNVK